MTTRRRGLVARPGLFAIGLLMIAATLASAAAAAPSETVRVLVLEPTGALALAALLEGTVAVQPDQRVGVLLSGGNVDLDQVGGLLQRGKESSEASG